MKTEEDEAFDDLAKRQGSWGGGYQAKRKMAADKLQEPEREALKLALEALERTNPRFSEDVMRQHEAITAIKEALAQPQRQWIWLSDADISDVIDTTCQYTGSYEEYLIKKAERKIMGMNT